MVSMVFGVLFGFRRSDFRSSDLFPIIQDREKIIDNLPTHLKHTLWLLGIWLVYVYLVKLAKL